MVRECVSKSPTIGVGQTFVTKFGNIRLIKLYDNSSGQIGIKPNKWNEIVVNTVDWRVEDVGPMTVVTNFFTLAGGGCQFWVCGPDKPAPPETCTQTFKLQDQNGNPLNGNVQIGTTAITVLGTGTITLEKGKSYSVVATHEGKTISKTVVACNIETFIFDIPVNCRQEFKVYDGLIGDAPGATVTINGVIYTTNSTGYTSVLLTTGKEYTAIGKFGDRSKTYTFTACQDILKFRLTTIIVNPGRIYYEAYNSRTNAVLNATVLIGDESQLNKTPGHSDFLIEGSYTLTFSLAGYLTETKTVEVIGGKIVNITVNMTEEQIPDTGFIKCQAYDSVSNAGLSATIRIDGTTIAPTTPHTTPALPIGPHTVSFLLAGYSPKTVTVTVKAGQTVNAYGSMVKVAVTGIVCSSVPAAASIYLDGKNTLQYTPHTLNGVSDGVHTITYYKSGYEPTSRVVNVITGKDVSAYALMFPSTTNTVKMRVYIQSGVSDVTEDTFHAFIKKVSSFYKSKGIDVNFIVHELKWINTPEPSSINLSGVDVVLVVGEGAGHFIGTIQRVGANLLNPFKFTQQGVVALAHEFGHYFGVIDQYWLNMPQTTTPVISSDIKSSIMYDSYTLTNGFSSFEKKIILSNLSKLQQGSKASILYPAERWSGELSIYIGKSNESCSIFASNRNYTTFNSSFPSTPTLVKSTDQNGILTFNMQNVSNRVEFDVYHIKCGTQRIWINSTILDQNYIENGIINVCSTKYVSNTQWCILAPLPAPTGSGFDIKINVPGILPKTSLHISQVVKVPLTKTWWDIPFGHGMRWDNISNGVYKARTKSANSSPTPNFHTGFAGNEDYAVYVGTSAVAFFPPGIIYRSTDKVTAIDITGNYIDWVSSKVCAALDISSANCPFFIASSVSDAAFFLELWTIITKHENLAGETTLPTALDYALFPIAIFGMLSPGISEGKIVQIVGKRITELIPLSRKGTTEIKAVLQDPSIDTFLLRATKTQFEDFVKFIEIGLHTDAKKLLKTVDDAPLSKNDLHALQRAANFVEELDPKLIKAGSIESIKKVLTRFSDKFKNIFMHALDFARDNPKTAVGVGILAIWFMIDNVPFYIYMYLKTKGRAPGDRSWQAKLYVDKIDQYKFNVINAEKIQDWDLFCSNLGLMENAVDTLETYILANKSTLENEETYGIYEGTVQVYREAIKLKREVHTCAITIPDVIDAEVMEILDSDTVRIKYAGADYTVRLLGINAPEGKNYDYTCTGIRSPFLIRRLVTPGKECIEEETWTGTEEMYNASKVWIGQNLPVHQIARFRSDTARQFDKYGRLLAVPYYNDKNVCRESLKAGHSVVFFYDDNVRVDKTRFLSSEKIAKDAKLGVWAVEAGLGTIRCVSTPTAAEVWLDGEYTGKKTISSVAYLYNIPVGGHTVTFKKIIDDVSQSCSKSVTVIKEGVVSAECSLVSGEIPPPVPPTEKATWQIGDVKNEAGTILNAAKVYVDNIYVKHYAPELLTFCTGCSCDAVVPCGFGSHTVTIKKTGYQDWNKTRTLGSGDSFTDNPVMKLIPSGTFPVTLLSQPSGATIIVDGETI